MKIKNSLLNIVIVLMVGVLCMTFISATGLNITLSNFNLNTTLGTYPTITFNITNTNPSGYAYSNFVSIQPSLNSPIIFPSFSLASGATEIVTANVTSQTSFNGVVDIQGFYNASLGQNQPTTHQINITQDPSSNLPQLDSSNCNIVINQGDYVAWFNNYTNPVSITTATGVNYQINNNSVTQSQVYSSVGTFVYTLNTLSTPIQTCSVTVLSNIGLVNNPNYDGHINLNLIVTYPPTILTTNYYNTTTFIINAQSSSQGGLSVSNIGNYTSYNLTLSDSLGWITSNINNLNIAVNNTQNIFYTITPQINSTNQTNQTYVDTLTLKDNNGDVQTQLFNIVIPYTVINSNNTISNITLSQLATNYLTFLQAFCNSNPNGIVQTSDGGSISCYELFSSTSINISNANTTESQLIKSVVSLELTVNDLMTYIKTNSVQQSQNLSLIVNQTNTTAQSALQAQTNTDQISNGLVIVIFIIIAIVAVIATLIITMLLKRRKAFNLTRHY